MMQAQVSPNASMAVNLYGVDRTVNYRETASMFDEIEEEEADLPSRYVYE